MRYVLFTALMFGFITISAQADYDQRLLSKYSEARILDLQREHPEVIDYWTFYLDNGYVILDGKVTGKTIKTDRVIKIKDLDNFNILDLDVAMDRKQSTAYRIQGTTKYLLVYSNQEFVNGFNNYRKTAGK